MSMLTRLRNSFRKKNGRVSETIGKNGLESPKTGRSSMSSPKTGRSIMPSPKTGRSIMPSPKTGRSSASSPKTGRWGEKTGHTADVKAMLRSESGGSTRASGGQNACGVQQNTAQNTSPRDALGTDWNASDVDSCDQNTSEATQNTCWKGDASQNASMATQNTCRQSDASQNASMATQNTCRQGDASQNASMATDKCHGEAWSQRGSPPKSSSCHNTSTPTSLQSSTSSLTLTNRHSKAGSLVDTLADWDQHHHNHHHNNTFPGCQDPPVAGSDGKSSAESHKNSYEKNVSESHSYRDGKSSPESHKNSYEKNFSESHSYRDGNSSPESPSHSHEKSSLQFATLPADSDESYDNLPFADAREEHTLDVTHDVSFKDAEDTVPGIPAADTAIATFSELVDRAFSSGDEDFAYRRSVGGLSSNPNRVSFGANLTEVLGRAEEAGGLTNPGESVVPANGSSSRTAGSVGYATRATESGTTAAENGSSVGNATRTTESGTTAAQTSGGVSVQPISVAAAACVIPDSLKESPCTSMPGMHRAPSEDLTCKVCNELFRRPRILPCLHTFCGPCIVNLQTYPISLLEDPAHPSTDHAPSSRDSAHLSQDSAHSSRDSAHRSRDSAHLSRDSAHLSRDSAQVSGDSAHTSRDSAHLSRDPAHPEPDPRELLSPSPVQGSTSSASSFSQRSGSSHKSSDSSTRNGEQRRSDGKRVVLCPTCLKETRVSRTLEELPRNYVMERRVAQDLALQGGVMRLECDSCAEHSDATRVTVRCLDCAENLCSLCELAHRRQKKTKRHQLIDVTPNAASDNPHAHQHVSPTNGNSPRGKQNHVVSKVPPPTRINCNRHPEEELKLFCMSCDLPICRDCVVVDHRDHDCQFLCQELFRRQMSEVQQMIRSVVPRITSVDQQLKRVADTQHAIRARADDVTQQIHQHMDSYLSAIKRHRQQLLQQVGAVVEEKQHALHVTERHLRHVRSDVEQTCRFVSDMIENASDVEILSVKRLVTDRLSGLKELTGVQHKSVSTFITFSPSEKGEVINNFQMFGRVVSRKASAAASTLFTEGLSTARVGHDSSVVLRVNSEDGAQYSGRDVLVKAWLIFQNQSIRSIPVGLHPQKNGTYSLRFSPVQQGSHFLHVAVDGQPVKDSPFKFKVKAAWRGHKGVWQCCSSCSSGGRVDLPCGCRGAMPGGQSQGCSHGQPGHPGGYHWSCCGKMVQTSECPGLPMPRHSPVRQVTL